MAISYDDMCNRLQALEIWRIDKDNNERHMLDQMKQHIAQIQALEDRLARGGPSGSAHRDNLASRSKGFGAVDKYMGGSSTKFEEWAFQVRQFFDALDPTYAQLFQWVQEETTTISKSRVEDYGAISCITGDVLTHMSEQIWYVVGQKPANWHTT